ncbi:glycosyl transferase family 2 [Geomonas silvestris]|uniref:Glycosyl transferase family 2 n=1 Tax=Geomonas silvestris TaxID=2740184 RepID=A0A6V8MJF7_9BACT|nr:glycosyltransferase [Geomonas silvestris]GFO60074.1 glycosyl transferase family 2 [Geomonas silvestris]
MHLCLIIPACDAGPPLCGTVSEALKTGYPVLVVDDGSRVCSSVFLAGLPVTVLRHPVHLGKGRALQSGFQWAADRGYSGVITLDADARDPAGSIRALAAAASSAEPQIFLGAAPVSDDEADLPGRCGRFAAWCLNKKTGASVAQAYPRIRYYPGAVLAGLALESKGPRLETEVLVKAVRSGHRIGSVPLSPPRAERLPKRPVPSARDALTVCLALLRYG